MRAEMLLGENGESLYSQSEEERNLPAATDWKSFQK